MAEKQSGGSPRARSGRPTIHDVAALAGVSIRTVSRAMNGDPTVSRELAERVREAANKLGYRPNLLASSLRRSDGRTATIAMLVDDVANPFSAALLRAVEDAARPRRVLVLIGSLDEDPEREQALVRTLIDRNVDGLIIVPTAHDQSYLVTESMRGCHVVFLDRQPHMFAGDLITSDNRGGARAAVEHLIAAGHSRIAYLGDNSSISTAVERQAGYRDALIAAGIAVEPELICADIRTVERAFETAAALFDREAPPTALFTSQNLVTQGTLGLLVERGLRHRIAQVGFDDFPLANLLDPGVTVVTQDAAELGRLATERLFARLDGDSSAPSTHLVPTSLITRGSGEIGPPRALAAVESLPLAGSPPHTA